MVTSLVDCTPGIWSWWLFPLDMIFFFTLRSRSRSETGPFFYFSSHSLDIFFPPFTPSGPYDLPMLIEFSSVQYYLRWIPINFLALAFDWLSWWDLEWLVRGRWTRWSCSTKSPKEWRIANIHWIKFFPFDWFNAGYRLSSLNFPAFILIVIDIPLFTFESSIAA